MPVGETPMPVGETPTLYVVRVPGSSKFYYFNEAQAKKQLLILSTEIHDDDNDGGAIPSMEVYTKGKWANLSRVSTTTLDFDKLSKIPADELTKLVDLLSVVD